MKTLLLALLLYIPLDKPHSKLELPDQTQEYVQEDSDPEPMPSVGGDGTNRVDFSDEASMDENITFGISILILMMALVPFCLNDVDRQDD